MGSSCWTLSRPATRHYRARHTRTTRAAIHVAASPTTSPAEVAEKKASRRTPKGGALRWDGVKDECMPRAAVAEDRCIGRLSTMEPLPSARLLGQGASLRAFLKGR